MSSSSSSTRRSTRSSTARSSSPFGVERTNPVTRSSSDRHVTVQRRSSPTGEASTSTANNSTDDAVQSILKARKCWRSIKGKEEAVWPPELEAALIEGLEKYRPAESKSTRVLGRFPMRNKFVADFIYDTTGVRRTPKQVGSRIQQLRDTNSGKHILKAISDRHYEMMRPKKREASAQPDTHTFASSSAMAGPSHYTTTPTNQVYIQALPPHASWPGHSLGGYSSSLYAPEARPLHMVDPTVTFTSPAASACRSSFRVFKDGRLVHEEISGVSLSPAGQPSIAGSSSLYMYTTSLVPQYWSHLCTVEDPWAYVIHQKVVRVPSRTSPDAHVLLSVNYHFVDALGIATPPLSPHSSCGSEVDVASFRTESSPLLGPLAPNASAFDLALHDGSEPLIVMPPLIEPYEDGYNSQPESPLDMPLVGITQWGYHSQALELDLSSAAASCDSYFDPSPYSPHVFPSVFQ